MYANHPPPNCHLTAYIYGSATAGSRGGGAGRGLWRPGRNHHPPPDQRSSGRLRKKQLPFNSPWNEPPPTYPTTHSQSAATVNCHSRHLDVGLQSPTTEDHSSTLDAPVVTKAQRNPWQRYDHRRPSSANFVLFRGFHRRTSLEVLPWPLRPSSPTLKGA